MGIWSELTRTYGPIHTVVSLEQSRLCVCICASVCLVFLTLLGQGLHDIGKL